MYDVPIDKFLHGALIFMRISALLFALPFFSDAIVGVRLRILMGVALTFFFFQIVPMSWSLGINYDILPLFYLLGCEILLGLTIGFVAKLIFEGVVMAADLVGYQMGFGTANLMLPGSDLQINAFTALHRIILMLVFLTLGFHYMFIHALASTFEVLPAGTGLLKVVFSKQLMQLIYHIFAIAMQLAAPILMALMFTMAALGLVARTVPQLNVFTLSFPLSFFIGLSVYLAMLPFLPNWLKNHYLVGGRDLYNAIESFFLRR